MATSSISNSEVSSLAYSRPSAHGAHLWLPEGTDEGARSCLKDRSALAVLLFVLGVALVAGMRSDVGYAEAPRWFWLDKLCWSSSASVVVAGDSRVYRGVDVGPLARAIGGEARNFGFSGTLLTPSYVEKAAKLLDPIGPRLLLIGITGASLRDPSRAVDGYVDAVRDLQHLRVPIWAARRLAQLDLYVRPWALDAHAGHGPRRAMADDYRQIFHEDGWVESDREVPDPVGLGVSVVRRDFEVSPHLTTAVDDLFIALESVRRQGVRVILFYPPVPEAVADVEQGNGDFDVSAIRNRAQALGLAWIDTEYEGLRSYDGTHLDGPSATKLGMRLADAVSDAKSRLNP